MSFKPVLPSLFLHTVCLEPCTPHLRRESVIGNRDWLSLQAKAAIIQPLTDEAIGGCYRSQL